MSRSNLITNWLHLVYRNTVLHLLLISLKNLSIFMGISVSRNQSFSASNPIKRKRCSFLLKNLFGSLCISVWGPNLAIANEQSEYHINGRVDQTYLAIHHGYRIEWCHILSVLNHTSDWQSHNPQNRPPNSWIGRREVLWSNNQVKFE